MAGNPIYTPFLLGGGVTKLSAAPVYIPEIQRSICKIDLDSAKEFTKHLLTLTTLKETKDALVEYKRRFLKIERNDG
jgi:phosphoenolpyruvate-protein kinase (PTS system EI component)